MEGVGWHGGQMEQTWARIRPIEAADRTGVLALVHRLSTGVAPWRDPEAVARAVHGWVVGSLDAADPLNAPVWVAVAGEDVVGFVTGGTREHWSGESDAYVGELVVAQEWSGQGVGRALMQAAEDWARAAGHDRVTLETGAANPGARAFYAALGYVEEEVVLTHAL